MNISLSLRQKIGQLMLFGFKGKIPSPEIKQLVREELVGGIILFAKNIGSPLEVLSLTTNLQSIAQEANHPFPLFISTDQENGIVRRLGEGTTIFPGSMLLGAVDKEEVTFNISYATAMELRALGINMNLTPVLDINNNLFNPVIGVRAFGDTTELVSRHAIAVINGHKKANVITTIKHFPGHGDTDIDSHTELPIINKDIEELKQFELIPFEQAIKTGVDSVMVAHIYFPKVEDRIIPSSLSKLIVTDLLRRQYSFDGVIITDCLEMDAVSKGIGTVEGALQALKAGNDIMIISHNHNVQKQAIDRIEQAVNKGEISESLIDQSVERVLSLKKKYLSWENFSGKKLNIPSYIGGINHEQLSQQAYKQGVTLVKNEGLLPLKLEEDEKILVIHPVNTIYTQIENIEYSNHDLAKAIKRFHKNIEEFRINTQPSNFEIDQIKNIAVNFNNIIIGTINALQFPNQAIMVEALTTLRKNVIVIAMRTPYDIVAMPDVKAFIAAYEHTEPALQVAAEVIFGVYKSSGKLPVTIPKNNSQ